MCGAPGWQDGSGPSVLTPRARWSADRTSRAPSAPALVPFSTPRLCFSGISVSISSFWDHFLAPSGTCPLTGRCKGRVTVSAVAERDRLTLDLMLCADGRPARQVLGSQAATPSCIPLCGVPVPWQQGGKHSGKGPWPLPAPRGCLWAGPERPPRWALGHRAAPSHAVAILLWPESGHFAGEPPGRVPRLSPGVSTRDNCAHKCPGPQLRIQGRAIVAVQMGAVHKCCRAGRAWGAASLPFAECGAPHSDCLLV